MNILTTRLCVNYYLRRAELRVWISIEILGSINQMLRGGRADRRTQGYIADEYRCVFTLGLHVDRRQYSTLAGGGEEGKQVQYRLI